MINDMIDVYLKLHNSDNVEFIGKCNAPKKIFKVIRRYLRCNRIRPTAIRLWENDNKTWFEANNYSMGYFYVDGLQLETLMNHSERIA